MNQPIYLLYGEPPRDLADLPANAVQCSPLIPGSITLEDLADASATSATLYTPPGTIERRYVLAQALRAMAEGGTLVALAPKDKGGSRIAAELTQFGCTVTDTSRAHHRIVSTTRPSEITIREAIAEGGPRQYPSDGLWTQPGVFSWDRIDTGSALLLKNLPDLAGRGADIGCGIGVLSQHVLRAPAVSELTLIDIDRRAIAAAQRNITDPRAHFRWADMRTGEFPTSALDFVVMNPPFHDTGIEDKTLGQTFITRAASMLKPGGTLWCVANKHLPYETLLASHFSRTTRIAEADGFKIYMSEK